MNLSWLFLASVALLGVGAALPLFFKNHTRAVLSSFVPMGVGSSLAVLFSALALISGSGVRFSSQSVVPILSFNFSFYVDSIAAFFILIVGVVSATVAVYSIGYVEHRGRSLGSLINLFVLSMVLVIASDNVLSFLVFWELMSLTSFFLVIFDGGRPENLKSGITYLIMTHLGTMLITVAFLILFFQTGSLSFDAFRGAAGQLTPYVKDVVFLSALVGFGTKAGLVPMHTWLPRTHPIAPSNVSALMSGVMLNVAIYGLVRVTLDFVAPSSPGDAWLGVAMIVTGSVSALVGVLYAAVEHDIKRALAYSSIENVGIIVLGLGLSVVFMSYGLVALASLALLASMFHSLNHAVFKGLLFMGAGSAVSRTGTHDMDDMGGLAKRMPWTALCFLVGSIAMAGLPPLNGFVSEWLTMQALFSSYQVPNQVLQISIGFASVVFALTIGLALATSVKLFGASFLARPRSAAAGAATEAPKTMLAGMAVAGALCVVLGFLPSIASSAIASAFQLPSGPILPSSLLSGFEVGYTAAGLGSMSSLSMPSVLVLTCCVGVGLFGFVLLAGSGRAPVARPYTTWDGGFGPLDERTEYTATSLSQPIRTVFKVFYRPHTNAKREYYSESNPLMKRSVNVTSQTREIFEDHLYSPVVRVTLFAMDKVRRVQTGKVNSYLLYMMVAVVALLLLAVIQY